MALEWVEGMITKIIDETSNTKGFTLKFQHWNHLILFLVNL